MLILIILLVLLFGGGGGYYGYTNYGLGGGIAPILIVLLARLPVRWQTRTLSHISAMILPLCALAESVQQTVADCKIFPRWKDSS